MKATSVPAAEMAAQERFHSDGKPTYLVAVPTEAMEAMEERCG